MEIVIFYSKTFKNIKSLRQEQLRKNYLVKIKLDQ